MEFLQQLHIKDKNPGVSTGANWIGSQPGRSSDEMDKMTISFSPG